MADVAQGRNTGTVAQADTDRLESWKEIAAHLKRDVRTVQRWERKEGLPVHRHLHDKMGSVYAFRSEIEEWRVKQRRTTKLDTKPSSLPRALYVLVVITVLGSLVIYGWFRKTRQSTTLPIKTIAVLPLENLSGDPTQEYLTDGLTDEVTTDLAKLGGLKVISRTSSIQYKGTRKPVPQIARELNVEAIVEGSYERSGDWVRVRVQLIRASTDQHLWAEEYDRRISDVFRLESEVAHDIAEHVELHLSQNQRQALARNHTVNPEAFQDYLQGRHYWALRRKESLHKAVEYFTLAIQKDPDDARSYAGLAHCYLVMPFLTEVSANEGFEKAREAAGRALTLDESSPEAHLANAEILLYRDWNLAGADEEFRRTLDLNQNYSTAHQWYGELLTFTGRHEEAVREERTALDLDPLSAIVHHELAGALRDAGRYDEAIREYHETLRMDPELFPAYWEMAVALQRQGKFAESIQALKAGAEGVVHEYEFNPAIIPETKDLEYAYASGGRLGYFQQSIKLHGYLSRPFYYLARDYAQLGEKESAIAELTHSYQNHEPEVLWMFIDPELEPLHGDSRFQSLVRVIGFQSLSSRLTN